MTHPSIFALTLVLSFAVTVILAELIGYDCNHNDLNYTIVDFNTIGECKPSSPELKHSSEEIQLVEIKDSTEINVYNCMVTITRHVSYCGMHSHSSEVIGGFMSYPYKIQRKRCKDAIVTVDLCVFCGTGLEQIYTNLQIGSSRRTMKLFAGSVKSKGDCEGAHYSDEFGT